MGWDVVDAFEEFVVWCAAETVATGGAVEEFVADVEVSPPDGAAVPPPDDGVGVGGDVSFVFDFVEQLNIPSTFDNSTKVSFPGTLQNVTHYTVMSTAQLQTINSLRVTIALPVYVEPISL